MCGIAGWVDKNHNIIDQTSLMEEMIDTLKNRGLDSEGINSYKNALLGHRRLAVVDLEGGHQPMTISAGENQFTIVYNGELYNTEDVRKQLIKKGYSFKGYSDTEVLLTAYIEWGKECLNYINGIFAFGIWNALDKTLFLARDPLGVKPLFYSTVQNCIIFASEIKALLRHPYIEPVVNEDGLLEILGLGPARSLGSGVFRDIKEVPPAHYIFYDERAELVEYWKLKAKPHDENIKQTIEHTRHLLIDTIERQLVGDVPLCTFLSGGLDSSIISSVAARYFKKNRGEKLHTYSIDYVDNQKHYVKNKFQPDLDSSWIDLISDYIDSQHTNVVLDNLEVAETLEEAVLANDLPGMADIDSSLYLFCREVKKYATVALSGECADEIFGGYPWFKNAEEHSGTFPWAKSVDHRKAILSKAYKNLPLEEYVKQKYEDTIAAAPLVKGESIPEQRMREMFYLNIKWFMMTLLNRKDRMSMRNSLEVRVPFADYRIVEYAYNIPKQMKFYNDREKGLLREALKGLLPEEILLRKKSPYPKTYNPVYTNAVQKQLLSILKDPKSPLFQITDYNTVKEIAETKGSSFKKPWYGQLMMGPQVMAYLIQINKWMKDYHVRIEV